MQRFSKCKACSAFKEALLMKLSKEELEKLRAQKKAHLLLQKICRENYYKHIKKAKGIPKKYLSLIIDNMDQSKTKLPRFHDIRKGEENNKTLHHHVTGVLNHGQGKTYVFTWTDKFTCDSNITINCLLNVFEDVAKNNDGRLPEVLYLQADNAAKDNKNVVIIAFLAGLVKRKIFKKIKLSFLMVGHTHEDVDQMFSSISKRLKTNSAPTLTELHNQIRLAHTPVPTVQQLTNLWDYRNGIKNHSQKLAGHQSPHVFAIRQNVNTPGKIEILYKDWPLKSETYKSLDVTDLAESVCSDRNPPVARNVDDKFKTELDVMEAGLNKWQGQGRIIRDCLLWWKKYLQSLRKAAGVPKTLPVQFFAEYQCHNDSAENVPEELSDIIEGHIKKMQKQSKVRLVNAS